MTPLKVLKIVITTVFVILFLYEVVRLIHRALRKDSIQSINELKFDILLPATITICPGLGFKKSGPFLSNEEFRNYTYYYRTVAKCQFKIRGRCCMF